MRRIVMDIHRHIQQSSVRLGRRLEPFFGEVLQQLGTRRRENSDNLLLCQNYIYLLLTTHHHVDLLLFDNLQKSQDLEYGNYIRPT